MRTFFIFTASAVLLAAITVELSTRLWPGNDIALLVIAALALLAQGYLSLRFAVPAPAQAGKSQDQNRAKSGGRNRSDRGEQAGRRDRKDGNNNKSSDTRVQKESTRPKRAEEHTEAQPAPSGDRETGTVKWFNRTKGFGFIVRESGEEIFVHQRSILSEGSGDNRRRPALKDGQSVTFVVANREKGLQAEEVSPA